MERQQLIGMALITVLVFGWFAYFQQSDPAPAKTAAQDSLSTKLKVDTIVQKAIQSAPDSSKISQMNDSTAQAGLMQRQYGAFAPLTQGESKIILVKTDKLNLAVSTKGGVLQQVLLNQFKTYDQKPLPVMPLENDNHYSMLLPIAGGSLVDTRDLYFKPSLTENIDLKGDAVKTLSLKAELGPQQYIEHIYTFKGNAYDVKHEFKLAGLRDVIASGNYYVSAQLTVPKTEKSYDNMLPEVNLSYLLKDDDEIEKIDLSTEGEKVAKSEALPIKWVGFKSQFFTTAIIAQNKFEDIDYESSVMTNKQTIRKFKATMAAPYSAQAVDASTFTYYFGPNDYKILSAYDVGLDKILSLGWGPLRYITLFMLYVFKMLENVTTSYGLIILILAVFIKIILSPLTYKSHISTAKMQIINKLPEMLELDKKYAEDPTALQQKKMAIYGQFGVSPFGGCLPLLLQMPILFAMFTFFPQSIELRQQPFLWAEDLSTYDSILDFGFNIPLYGDHVSLFTLLMTISTLLMTYIQQQGQPATGPAAQMKYMGYIMPIMFLGILNNYSAGLSYYYLLQNVLTLGQTFVTKRLMNEEKLKEKLHQTMLERKKKGGGKKSWLERKLEENQKLMQEQQRKQPKGKK